VAASFGLVVFVAWATVRLFSFTAAGIYDRIGRERLESKRYKEAEFYLGKSVRLAGRNLDYRLDLGGCLYGLAGQTKDSNVSLAELLQAKREFSQATHLNPREGQGWFGLAQTCWWLSRFPGHEKEAENVAKYFRQALCADPNNGEFLEALVGYLARASAREGRRSGEISANILRLGRVYPSAYNDLKKLPNWSGEWQADFVKGLKTAASNRLTRDTALSVLAGISVDAGQWGKAADYTARLIKERGDLNPSYSTYFDLGYYRLMAGRTGEAKGAFLKGLELSDNRVEALDNLLSRLSGCVHSPASASLAPSAVCGLYLDVAKQTAGIDPSVFSELPMIQGKGYLYIGDDLDHAAACFRRAIKARDHAAPHRYLAEIASRRKDWDTMEMESNRAILLSPGDSELYCLLAGALQNQQRYIAAIEAIDEAIKHSPQPNADYYNIKGRLYGAFNDYPDAIQAWEAASRIDPKASWPHSQIARAYEMMKKSATPEHHPPAAVGGDPAEADIAKEIEALKAQVKGTPQDGAGVKAPGVR
jgi:tetratricopeptide (TPR) repeat protein